ncbi:hypothetical protein JCM11641_000624 [Rhodosporidiobolus odoratus]
MSSPYLDHRLQSSLLPECSAFVKLDGRDAEVLGSVNDDQKSKSYCYIESWDGAFLEMGFRDRRTTPGEDDFVLRLFVDGQLVNSTAFQTSDPLFRLPPQHGARVTTWSGRLAGGRAVQRVRLEDASFTDQEDEAASAEQQALVESIRVSYNRVRTTQYAEPEWPAPLVDEPFFEDKPDAMRGVFTPGQHPTHRACYCLADEIEQPIRAWLAFDWINEEDEPYWTFEWRYRSRADTPPSISSCRASPSVASRQEQITDSRAKLKKLEDEEKAEAAQPKREPSQGEHKGDLLVAVQPLEAQHASDGGLLAQNGVENEKVVVLDLVSDGED